VLYRFAKGIAGSTQIVVSRLRRCWTDQGISACVIGTENHVLETKKEINRWTKYLRFPQT